MVQAFTFVAKCFIMSCEAQKPASPTEQQACIAVVGLTGKSHQLFLRCVCSVGLQGASTKGWHQIQPPPTHPQHHLTDHLISISKTHLPIQRFQGLQELCARNHLRQKLSISIYIALYPLKTICSQEFYIFHSLFHALYFQKGF